MVYIYVYLLPMRGCIGKFILVSASLRCIRKKVYTIYSLSLSLLLAYHTQLVCVCVHSLAARRCIVVAILSRAYIHTSTREPHTARSRLTGNYCVTDSISFIHARAVYIHCVFVYSLYLHLNYHKFQWVTCLFIYFFFQSRGWTFSSLCGLYIIRVKC